MINSVLFGYISDMEQDKNKELGDEQIYFLHQKNVEIIQKTKKDIVEELNHFVPTPQSLLDMSNKDFNETLITTYKPFIERIAYETFVDKRCDYEDTKKEVLKRIEKLKKDEEIWTLIKMLEIFREEAINTTNFIKFYRIISLFIQKGKEHTHQTKDIKDTINDITMN
jgi:DNA-directed RNA polymerase specialized sigma subunit